MRSLSPKTILNLDLSFVFKILHCNENPYPSKITLQKPKSQIIKLGSLTKSFEKLKLPKSLLPPQKLSKNLKLK